MTTHAGNAVAETNSRPLHRFRYPKDFWGLIEKSYVLFAFCGIIFSGMTIKADDPFRTTALLVAVLIFFVLSSVASIALSWINGEKAKYAEIIEHIHQSMHTIRDLDVYLTSQINFLTESQVSIKSKLQHDLSTVLDRLALAASIVSGTRIVVTLNQAVIDNNQMRIEVLARDTASRPQWKHQDDVQVNHWVSNNTSLRQITVKAVNYYYNGQVHKSQDYESSFFEHWRKDPKYKSCMVFPIRAKDEKDGEYQYCGFLQMVSSSQKAMNLRYDSDLGAAIADSLYLVLLHYRVLCSPKGSNVHNI